MTTDPLTRTVREQVALGRLIPLGGPDDAAWITESAAVRVLRGACAGLSGVRLGAAGISLPAGVTAAVPGGAAPLGALPHVPVRIDAGFEAAADEPLPLAARRLRAALWHAAEDLLGVAVASVDLRVTGLLDAGHPAPGPEPDPRPDPVPPATPEAVAAAGVPGVLGLTGQLAGLGPGIAVEDTAPPADAAGPPTRRIRIQLAVTPPYVPLAVARAVSTAVTAAAAPAAPGPVTTAVLVTYAG